MKGTTRREFLHTAASGLAAGGMAAGGLATGGTSFWGTQAHAAKTGQGGAQRPNFVYILCDDLGYGDLGCYGHPAIQTPRLDAMAAEGVRLTDCYAPAPVCSPARAGVMTGRNPYRCGIADWIPQDSPVHLLEGEPSVAELLRGAGYTTAHVGKWHLAGTMDGSQPTPGDHGFDYWFATQNNAAPSHKNPVNFVRNGEPVGALEGYSSALIVDEAIHFLRETASEPFALFVWFHSPHEPVATAPKFQKPYEAEYEESKASYFGNVTQIDFETGRLLDALDDMGHGPNTLVMFTSDNGPETLDRYRGASRSHGSPGPLRGMKLHMHEAGIRVPGIVRWPGRIDRGIESAEPVDGTDVLPTLCNLAGVKLPEGVHFDGASMAPLLDGKQIQRKTPLFWRYDKALSEAKLALREGPWKLLADNAYGHVELYNLAEDLDESDNLAERNPDKRDALLAKLKEINEGVNSDLADAKRAIQARAKASGG